MSLKPLINLSITKSRTTWHYVPQDVIQKEYSTYDIVLPKNLQPQSNQISRNFWIKRNKLNSVTRKPLCKSRNSGNNPQDV